MKNQIHFTKEGFEKLVKELSELTKIGRPQAVERLQKARAMGDLSENSEYSAAKEELAFVEGRIKEIDELMKRAKVIESSQSDGIGIGSQVTVEKDGQKETFYIVGEFEADPVAKKLSATSPIGKALLGKKVGEIIFVEVPVGKLKYEIIKIDKE